MTYITQTRYHQRGEPDIPMPNITRTPHQARKRHGRSQKRYRYDGVWRCAEQDKSVTCLTALRADETCPHHPPVIDMDLLPGMNIGKRISYLRGLRNLSQQQLARLIGYSKSWVEKVERGILPVVKIPTLYRLAKVLRVDAALLFIPPVDTTATEEAP